MSRVRPCYLCSAVLESRKRYRSLGKQHHETKSARTTHSTTGCVERSRRRYPLVVHVVGGLTVKKTEKTGTEKLHKNGVREFGALWLYGRVRVEPNGAPRTRGPFVCARTDVVDVEGRGVGERGYGVDTRLLL